MVILRTAQVAFKLPEQIIPDLRLKPEHFHALSDKQRDKLVARAIKNLDRKARRKDQSAK
jgi:hypothetical protein